MSNALDRARERMFEYEHILGVETINLVIKRHLLSDEKRLYFTIRFAEEDKQKEDEITCKMNELGDKIQKLDDRLYELGVDSKLRTQMIRDIKKVYPDEWINGFF